MQTKDNITKLQDVSLYSCLELVLSIFDNCHLRAIHLFPEHQCHIMLTIIYRVIHVRQLETRSHDVNAVTEVKNRTGQYRFLVNLEISTYKSLSQPTDQNAVDTFKTTLSVAGNDLI